MGCYLCGMEMPETLDRYRNSICYRCDDRAVGGDDDRPWHGWPPGEAPRHSGGDIVLTPDAGENPVFVDGRKCWRRYRFGGWVTMVDEWDCESWEAFMEAADPMIRD
jgi:hypothetical protein